MPHFLKYRDIKKTRVKHHCQNCNRIIKIGEACIETCGIYDNHVYSVYSCDVCLAFEKHMDKTFSKEDKEVIGFFSEEFQYVDIEGYSEFAATYVIEKELETL